MKHFPASRHGSISEVFDNVFFVRGGLKMPMLMPMKISRSMTILRQADTRKLTVVNSMRLTEKGFAELEQLGEVDQVLRIAGFHGRDDGYYRERYGAKILAVEGQSYSRKLDAGVPKENYLEPDGWLTEGGHLPVEGAQLKVLQSSRPPEAVLLLESDGGILVTGDSLQHTPSPDEFTNFMARIMMKKMGFYVPYNVGPGWLKFAKPTEEDVRSLIDLDFDHVLPGHGSPVVGGAKEKYRPALTGPL